MPKLLIVDDNKDNLISLGALIKALIPDIILLTAQSGEEGIKTALQENPDTILLDIHMPKMNGFEVCKKLKLNRKTWRIPIILITAIRTDAESRIQGLEIGADAFLSKPIDEGELVAQVKAMLRIRNSEQLLSKEKDLLEELVVERTQKMKEKGRYYQTILESIHEDILIIDPNYVITEVNQSFLDTTGYTKDEVIGNHCYNISHNFDSPCSSQEEECFLREVFETGKPAKYQHSHKSKGIPDITVDILLSPITNEKGEVVLVIETIRDISDLMKAQALFKNEMEFTNKLIQAVQDTVFVFDTQTGQALRWNMAFNKITGCSDEEIAAKKAPDEWYSKEDLKRAEAYIKREFRGEAETIDLELITKDGKKIPFEYSAAFIEGQKNQMISIGRNVTEPKKAEKALQEEKVRAERYLQMTRVMFVALDAQGTVTLINEKGCDILGYKESEILGQNWFDKFLPKNIQDGVKSVFNKLIKGDIEPVEYYENPVFTKKGKERIIAFYNSLIKDDNGKIIGTLSSGEDITQRILAEETLTKSEQKLKEYSKTLEQRVSERTQELHQALENTEVVRDRIDAIIKSVSNGLIVTDIHNRIILMNYAAEELLGIRFSDVINRSIDLAIKEKTLRERFRTTIEEKPAGYYFDFEIPGKDPKKPHTLHASTSVIFDKDHNRSGVVMIFHDVTKEREVDRMKTDFLTTAAHELRTPLTSIQGFSEILLTKEALSTKEREKYLTYINDQSLVLSDLIHDLLDLSRIESGIGLTFKIVKCQGDQLIKQVLSFFKNLSPQHTFDLDLPQKSVDVRADKKKVEQVLKNLLDNAIKYSPDEDKIRIQGVIQNDFFQVSIQDNGIGMTPKQVRQIFSKFYRANHGDTQPSGTGLGLTIVKYIVEKHRGKVLVDSKLGKGTTISFTLPLWKPSSK